MAARQMIIGMELGNDCGTQAGAWRAPGVDPTEYLNYDVRIGYAKAAERGKLQFLFFPNGPYHRIDIEHESPHMTPDLAVHTAILARATERIGFVVSGSTLNVPPYILAAQFKMLDFVSHGRVAWNTVASAHPDATANFGTPMMESEERYTRAGECIELVQELWASWGRDAWVHDQITGQYTRPGQVKLVDFEGKYLTSRGPLYVPPSEQGQPVIAQSGVGPGSFALAGRYADLSVGSVTSIEDARQHRDMIRQYAVEAGRDPNEVKYVAGFHPTIGTNMREALDRRASLVTSRLPTWLPLLGRLLGVPLTEKDLDRVVLPSELGPKPTPDQDWPDAILYTSRIPAQTERARALVTDGFSVRDILAHGLFDEHPSSVGTATDAADHMQEWFESGVVDGFWVAVDVYRDGIDTFVDEVVPILQDRGLFHREYEGSTLREHLGALDQYGPDFRVAQTAKK